MSGQRSKHMMSSRRMSQTSKTNFFSGSTSKRNVAFESRLDKVPPKKKAVKVFDDAGNDVTPRSLLPSDSISETSSKGKSKAIINFNESTSSGVTSDMFNQSMFNASTLQASYAAGFSRSIMSSVMGSSRASIDSVADDIVESNSTSNNMPAFDSSSTLFNNDFTDEDLEKLVSITLEETDTIWHLDVEGEVVSSDQQHETKERNEIYKKLCESRAGNDMYAERSMQTFNDAMKTKEAQTSPILYQEQSCQATTWDMYDSFNVNLEESNDGVNCKVESSSESTTANKESEITSTLDQSMMTESTTSLASQSFMNQPTSLSDTTNGMSSLAMLSNIDEKLFFLERTIVQSLYHERQAVYKGVKEIKFAPIVEEESENNDVDCEKPVKLGPNLSRLWSYGCNKTKGLTVNCMVWNKINKDLLGVGYGIHGNKSKGLICVWTVKNPEQPERVYSLESDVTAIDFSLSHPNLLAVGMKNGSISVYNIRNTDNSHVLDSAESNGKHGAPIWQLQWVERDKGTGEEKGEVLVSASADGRITQWCIRKGLEFMDLMKLKRVSAVKQSSTKKSDGLSKKSDALILRLAAGLCIDFHPVDGNMYIAGTEEGFLHRCSCSYNEQYLETYTGHKGPIYKTMWSPFDNDVFMSCSIDWTIRLWHVDNTQPIITLQSAVKAYVDVDWSPFTPVLLSAINQQQIEIWDLSSSILDPIIVNLPVSTAQLTTVKFALNSESLLVGDSDGQVTIYQLREIQTNASQKDVRLINVLIETQTSLGEKKEKDEIDR